MRLAKCKTGQTHELVSQSTDGDLAKTVERSGAGQRERQIARAQQEQRTEMERQ